MSNIPTASAAQNCALVLARAGSPPLPQRRETHEGPSAEHDGPRSPDLVRNGAGSALGEARTPPLSVRASSTLQELLKSNCGRNAQSAIREVLACLAAEERKLEDVTAPQCASPCRESQDRVASAEHAVCRAVPFDGATDTSQSHDTLLEASLERSVEASAQASFQHEGRSAVRESRDVVGYTDSDSESYHAQYACDVTQWHPGMHARQAEFCNNQEETVRVVASSCGSDMNDSVAVGAHSRVYPAASEAEQLHAGHGRASGASRAPQEARPQRAVQTQFSLVTGRAGDGMAYPRGVKHGGGSNVYEARLQMYSLQSLPPAPDSQSSQPAQLSELKVNGGADTRGRASTGNIHSNPTRPPGPKAAPRNGNSAKSSKRAPKKVRCHRGRSISARRTPVNASMPEHPAWKPPCGPLATSADAPRTRVSPIPSTGRVLPPVENLSSRPAKGKLKAKRAKKVKSKRAASKGPVATHASAVGGEDAWELSWARDGSVLGAAVEVGGSPGATIAAQGGGLERMFGTKASRAATLAKIRGVQAATAMAATAHLRQACYSLARTCSRQHMLCRGMKRVHIAPPCSFSQCMLPLYCSAHCPIRCHVFIYSLLCRGVVAVGQRRRQAGPPAGWCQPRDRLATAQLRAARAAAAAGVLQPPEQRAPHQRPMRCMQLQQGWDATWFASMACMTARVPTWHMHSTGLQCTSTLGSTPPCTHSTHMSSMQQSGQALQRAGAQESQFSVAPGHMVCMHITEMIPLHRCTTWRRQSLQRRATQSLAMTAVQLQQSAFSALLGHMGVQETMLDIRQAYQLTRQWLWGLGSSRIANTGTLQRSQGARLFQVLMGGSGSPRKAAMVSTRMMLGSRRSGCRGSTATAIQVCPMSSADTPLTASLRGHTIAATDSP